MDCCLDHDRDDLDAGCPGCGDKQSQIDYCWWIYHELLYVEAFYAN